MHDMSSRKRKQPCFLSSSQLLEITQTLCPDHDMTNGAVEGLRVSLEMFLARLGKELSSDVGERQSIISTRDVTDALTRMKLQKLAKQASEYLAENAAQKGNTRAKRKPPKRKKIEWTREMEVEQERLLAESREKVNEKTEPGT